MNTTSLDSLLRGLIVIVAVACLASVATADQTVFFTEDWEDGMGDWSANNGSWQAGSPSGGCTAYGGNNVAATDLTGYYARHTNSRLESPLIELPATPADGQIWLHFWHWFGLHPEGDYSRVEISVNGGAFTAIGVTFYNYSGVWSPYMIDLSEYAGDTIQIGFRMIDSVPTYPDEYWGWYVDDVTILEGKYEWQSPCSFDTDCHGPEYGGWYADRGVWEIGAPTHGISAPYSGLFCAGTRLHANYPRYANSRLISPPVEIPAAPMDGQVWLSFMHWYKMHPEGDYARVEILIDGSWEEIQYASINEYSGSWTEKISDLTPYLGQTVRFGFRIIDSVPTYPDEHRGWFIDDVAIVEGPLVFNNPDSFEGGSRGWFATNGSWQVGAPTSGPGAAHSGEHCWATGLAGNYEPYTNSALFSPAIEIPANPDGPVQLKFWHWHSFNAEGDWGVVRIYPEAGETADISATFVNTSDWTQYVTDDLAPTYAGQTVQIGFYFNDVVPTYPDQSSGWYIDDIELTGLAQSTPQGWPDVGINYPSVTYSPDAPALQWFYNPFDPEFVAVYASRNPEFIPNLGNRIALLGDDPTSWVDEDRPGWGYFYKIALIDDLWHESPPGPASAPYTAAPDQVLPGAPLADLQQNYPNPFNPRTTMRFKLSRNANVTLEVFDVAGRKVSTLMQDRPLTAGIHEVPFEPRELASGLYLCRLNVDGEVQTRKMVLTK